MYQGKAILICNQNEVGSFPTISTNFGFDLTFFHFLVYLYKNINMCKCKNVECQNETENGKIQIVLGIES